MIKKKRDFITHGLWHCVIEVGKDSSVMGVDKDSSVMGVSKDTSMVHG